MTEADWVACTDLDHMLHFARLGRVSDRKLRLCAVGVCRLVWTLLDDIRSRAAVEIAEQFADGLVEYDALCAAEHSAKEVGWAVLRARGKYAGSIPFAAGHAAEASAVHAAKCVIRSVQAKTIAAVLHNGSTRDFDREYLRELYADTAAFARGKEIEAARAQVLHDILGNPFRQHFIDASVRLWRDGIILGTARRIYEMREYGFLPFLADLLQEDGYQDVEVLTHFRSPEQMHCRGCWGLDLILGKS